MKYCKPSLIYLFVILLLSVNTFAQSISNKEITELGFTAKLVAEGVWLIDDHRNDNMYLVEGNENALLIDTGIGAGDLKKFVKSITDLPIIVVNTHAHGDHVNGNFQFPEVYIHPKEFNDVKRTLTKENRNTVINNMINSNPEYDKNNILEVNDYQVPVLKPIEEGFIFDLGNRKLEVIEVPGHTPGSICLLDRENKLLFSGDNNCIHIWLFMYNSTTVETYMESLQKLMSYSEHFDLILPGHLEPMGKDYLDEVHACISNILYRECEPKPYQTFGDNVRHCTYKRAIVAFNPERIFND